ncbi:MAG: redoxin domain-containing protein [Flavobacteriales bacterium]|nr:redoxin domain-containing protein [Flavobacteriales bacterium]
MLQRIHPFTSLGLVLLVLAPAFIAVGLPLLAVALMFLAHAFALLEFKKYTSHYQFAMIVASATIMGIFLDLWYMRWPWLTLAMFCASTATVARQAFMQRFTYMNLLWADTGLAVVALGCYLTAIRDHAFAWDLWLAPVLPIASALMLTFGYVQDARHIRHRSRNGYRVRVDSPAPDFELPDQDGRPVRLSDYRGKHPVLLIFVRGDWCPGCHMMLRTYERNRSRFLEKGVHVLAIGPDDIAVNSDMVARIGVGFRLLSDDQQAISGRYGVVYNNPVLEVGVDYERGIPLPASFLVDADGVVRYVSRPDRVGEFLDPELIFSVLDRIRPVMHPV